MGLVGVWTGFLDGVDFVHDSGSFWMHKVKVDISFLMVREMGGMATR